MSVTAKKSRVVESVTGKSASYTGLVILDTRGMKDLSFLFETPAITGGDASNYMIPTIMGCRTRKGTFAAVPGGTTATKFNAATSAEHIPTPANSPGVVFPRFLRFDWAETGAVTGVALKTTVFYNRDRTSGPPGRGGLGDSGNLP